MLVIINFAVFVLVFSARVALRRAEFSRSPATTPRCVSSRAPTTVPGPPTTLDNPHFMTLQASKETSIPSHDLGSRRAAAVRRTALCLRKVLLQLPHVSADFRNFWADIATRRFITNPRCAVCIAALLRQICVTAFVHVRRRIST